MWAIITDDDGNIKGRLFYDATQCAFIKSNEGEEPDAYLKECLQGMDVPGQDIDAPASAHGIPVGTMIPAAVEQDAAKRPTRVLMQLLTTPAIGQSVAEAIRPNATDKFDAW